MVVSYAVNHLLNEHRLTHAGTTKQANLASLHVGSQQVDDLNSRLEHLGLRLQLVETRWLTVDRPGLTDVQLLAVLEIQYLTGRVKDVTFGDVAHGNRDRCTRVPHRRSTHKTIRGLERNCTHHVVTEVLRGLQREGESTVTGSQVDVHFQSEVKIWHRIGREFNVDHRADDTCHPASSHRLSGFFG